MNPAIIILAICALFIISLFFWGRQFLDLPGKYRYPLLAALVGGMGYSIWWMQNDAEEKEIAFMGVCWIDGKAYLPEGGIGDSEVCPTPGPIKWQNKELSVYWDLEKDFNVYSESHSMAIAWWNKQLGWKVFSATPLKGSADIIIVHGSVNEGRGAMATSFTRDASGKITAIITVKVPGDTREWMLEEKHEYGHVLGLGHGLGIMQRSLREGDSQKAWSISRNNIAAIKKLYSPPEPTSQAVPEADASLPSTTPVTP